ncbi:hypothetical protein BDV19DRAFT_394184 [Aspergillus venezuelensis]
MTTTRLSTRVSLRWPPEPAFENTDTLVLSVGNWYVDLRVDKATQAIDWAIAGERLPAKDSNEVLFTHELDSRNTFGVADCGSFSALPNGGDLEVGSMPRPDLSGAPVREYEEVWRELGLPKVDGGMIGQSFVLDSVIDQEGVAEGDEREVDRTFIGAISGTYIVLRQRQVLARRDSKLVTVSGGEVSARREDYAEGIGFKVKYKLGPEAMVLPARGEIQFDTLDGPQKRIVVRGQDYIVRSFKA